MHPLSRCSPCAVWCVRVRVCGIVQHRACVWCVYGSSVHKNTHFLLGARLQAPYSRGSPPSHALFRNPLLSFKALQCLPTCPGLRRSVWHLSKHKAHPKDTADQAVVVDRFPQCCHTRSRLLEKGVMEMGCVQPVFSEGPMFRFNDESVALTQTTGSRLVGTKKILPA